MERDELNQRLRDLGAAVDEKCPTATFKWALGFIFAAMGIIITISVGCMGGLYARQNILSDSMAGMNVSVDNAVKTIGDQQEFITVIAAKQGAMAVSMGQIGTSMKAISTQIESLIALSSQQKPMSKEEVQATIWSELYFYNRSGGKTPKRKRKR